MAQITDVFEVEGFVEQRKELDKLLMGNPAMEKKVQGLIRKVLGEVRRMLGQAARDPSVMKSDPRQAYKAVRTMVYKRILGGNVPGNSYSGDMVPVMAESGELILNRAAQANLASQLTGGDGGAGGGVSVVSVSAEQLRLVLRNGASRRGRAVSEWLNM